MQRRKKQFKKADKAVQAYKSNMPAGGEPMDLGSLDVTVGGSDGGDKTVEPAKTAVKSGRTKAIQVNPATSVGAGSGRIEPVNPLAASPPLERDTRRWITVNEEKAVEKGESGGDVAGRGEDTVEISDEARKRLKKSR